MDNKQSDGEASALAAVLFTSLERAYHTAGKLFDETVDLFADRLLPLGNEEIASALFSQSNAYVKYGASQRPLDSDGETKEVGESPAKDESQTNVHGNEIGGKERGGRSM